jgi:penicillin-binding protein 1C
MIQQLLSRYRKLLIPLAVLAGGFLFIYLLLLISPFPELDKFLDSPVSLRVTDRNGTVLSILPLENGMRREYLGYGDIPRFIRRVFIKSEDKRFYYHPGVDPLAMLRAVRVNMKEGRIVTGASTITMQLSRVVAPHEGGLSGKAIEIVNALRLEARFSKKRIMELYLNSIPFGYNAVGVQSASKMIFARGCVDLSPEQVIALSLVPRSPARYHPGNADDRHVDKILELAQDLGVTTDRAKVERELKDHGEYQWEFNAPHFVGYVREGLTAGDYRAGGTIATSLDLDLTNVLQDHLQRYLEEYQDFRITNGAMLVVHNESGSIVSYIGSRQFFDEENSGQIDGVHVLNQPGSTLKSLLFCMALDNGFSAADVLPDIPLEFGNDEVYIPMNFNRRFHGPVRLRVALASSLNVPAVYMVTRLGVNNFVETLIDCGIESIVDQQGHLGSGIALGNCEISLYELVQAFSILPRGGMFKSLTWRNIPADEGIYPNQGGESAVQNKKQIFSPQAAWTVCDILSDDSSRILGFGETRFTRAPYKVMVKTGTSNQFNNIWALAATSEFTAGVWMGNFDGETVVGRTGSSLPLKLASRAIYYLSENGYPKDFEKPEGLREVKICSLSGMKCGEHCPGSLIEYLPEESSLDECSYHIMDKNGVVVQYPPLYAEWVRDYRGDTDVHMQDDSRQFPSIERPRDGAVFYHDPTLPESMQAVKIQVINDNKKERLDLFLNGRQVDILSWPWSWYLEMKPGTWRIEVVGSNGSDSIEVEIR